MARETVEVLANARRAEGRFESSIVDVPQTRGPLVVSFVPAMADLNRAGQKARIVVEHEARGEWHFIAAVEFWLRPWTDRSDTTRNDMRFKLPPELVMGRRVRVVLELPGTVNCRLNVEHER